MKKEKCTHSAKKFVAYKTTPFETGIRNFNHIANYFLYGAPNIDSIHSPGKIEGTQSDVVFDEMMQSANMQGKYKFLQRIHKTSFAKYNLDGDSFCMQCNRMVCAWSNSENKLTCVLRHIRNSLAHGQLYIWRKDDESYIFLQDLKKEKKKNEVVIKITARIVLTYNVLNNWKSILESEIATGE